MTDSRNVTVTFTKSEWNVVMTALSFIDKRVASPIVTKLVEAQRPTETRRCAGLDGGLPCCKPSGHSGPHYFGSIPRRPTETPESE